MANSRVQRLTRSYRLLHLVSLNSVCAFSLLLLCAGVEAQSTERGTDELRKLNESAAALIKKVSPSVVQILVTGYGPLEEGEKGSTSSVIGRQRAIVSGFVVDPSGYIVPTHTW